MWLRPNAMTRKKDAIKFEWLVVQTINVRIYEIPKIKIMPLHCKHVPCYKIYKQSLHKQQIEGWLVEVVRSFSCNCKRWPSAVNQTMFKLERLCCFKNLKSVSNNYWWYVKSLLPVCNVDFIFRKLRFEDSRSSSACSAFTQVCGYLKRYKMYVKCLLDNLQWFHILLQGENWFWKWARGSHFSKKSLGWENSVDPRNFDDPLKRHSSLKMKVWSASDFGWQGAAQTSGPLRKTHHT